MLTGAAKVILTMYLKGDDVSRVPKTIIAELVFLHERRENHKGVERDLIAERREAAVMGRIERNFVKWVVS